MVPFLRKLTAPTAALLLAVVGAVVLTATPADAATPAFYGTRGPLEWMGTTYDGPPFTETGNGVTYIGDDGTDTWVDTGFAEEISGFSGGTNVHAALAAYDYGAGTQNVTILVSDQVLQDASGGPYAATCAGIDAALFGGDPACDAVVPDILTANGAATDYSDSGTGGAIDASDNPTTVNQTDDVPPAIVWPLYQGTASPLALDGTDYTASVEGAPGTGSNWVPGGAGPVFVTSGDSAVPLFPNAGLGSIYPTHALLVDANGQLGTAYLDGVLLAFLDPMNPYPASCPGFEAFMTAVMQSGIDCIAFRADMWAPPDTLGEQYTCAADWFDGWTDENGDPLGAIPTVVDGFAPPALTPIGVDAGPGVCPASVPPEPPVPPLPPDPPEPPFDPPIPPPDGGDSVSDSVSGGAGTGTGSVPTLPATGVGVPALLTLAIGVLALGTGLSQSTRRLRRSRR